MKRVRVAVHQSRSLSESRKLVARTKSASVAVVSEIAPRWMTASSLRLSSQPTSSPGGTTSATWHLPRLRHLSASPNESLTTMSVRPASFRPATRLEPMKPAPPVTNNIAHPPPLLPPLCPRALARATCSPEKRKNGLCPPAPRAHWTGTSWQATGLAAQLPLRGINRTSPLAQIMNLNSFISAPLEDATADMSGARVLIIPYMWIGDFVRCHTVVKLLRQRSPSTSVDMLTT